ncbi:NAC domain-containing protein 83-like [Argentina anserina]|uniref:NAC domain-containing protein 83-like n=1 Tax=Argentina anserina TaxID=57926 RepID=UPI00217633B3|nr:NAC domain-containing protein 83-like [Potentilla anserina]
MAFRDYLPPGYKFRPDTEQLLVHYLRPKLDGEDFPQGLVPFCDLYGDQEPWQIWDEYFKKLSEKDQERTDLYFITKHKMKTPKGKRKSRSVGKGTWKGDDAAEKVLSASRTVIGKRKRFHYEDKGTVQNGRWLMHEFELDSSLLRNKRKAKDYVLCILRKNTRPVKKNSEQDQEEDEMNHEVGDDQQDGGLPEPEIAKEQTSNSATQESYDMRKYAIEMEAYQKIQIMKKNDHTDLQKQDERRKYAMKIEVYLKQQIARDQAKRNNDLKESHKLLSLEEMENFLMNDD